MKKIKIKTIKALRNRLKKSLPEKIATVIDSYESFLEKGIPEDAKGFSAHHSACKSAVIHADSLLKLAKWTTENEDEQKHLTDDFDNIMKILAEAKDEKEETENN